MSERVKLVNFLIHILSLFPSWRGMYHVSHMVRPTISPTVLSWDVIIGILSEEHYIADQVDINDESANVPAVGLWCQFSIPERSFL